MKQEYAEQLLRRFPQLYRAKEDASFRAPLQFGFEVYDGWFELIWELSESLEMLAEKEGRREKDWPAVVQVKEKFGGLRYYSLNLSEEMRSLIGRAEEKSFHVCEDCGAPGQTYSADGWLVTRCAFCAAKVKKQRNPKLWKVVDMTPE
jgi:hypothetical protein